MLNTSTRLLRAAFCIFLAAITFATGHLHAQLTTTPNSNGTQLVQQLMGPGITVSNVVLNCAPNGAGTFNGTASNLGIGSGILLTSGDVATAAQPNTLPGAGTDMGMGGDADLTILAGSATEDACALEFDFVAQCDTISIAYVFASEEYDEYVCATFNDVFGFFLTGPGYANTNIALVPGTATPVSINTVNNGSIGSSVGVPGSVCNLTNSAFYTSNAGGATHEYDGQTVRLLATARITPCSTYHVKLVIADAFDGIYDSGVFLEQNGFNCNETYVDVSSGLSNPTSASAIEGCLNGFFQFDRQGDLSQPYTVSYTVGGTATPGVDFGALSGTFTFPANQQTGTIAINPISDFIPEGAESVFIIFTDTICSVVSRDTAFLTITDELEVDAGADQSICPGNATTIGAAQVGTLTYSWTPGTGLSSPTSPNPNLSLSTQGSFDYIVVASNGLGCFGRDTMTLTVSPTATINFDLVQNVSCFGANDGCIDISATGGTGHYSYLWSNSATTDSICGLSPGTYIITVTDTLFSGGSNLTLYTEDFDGGHGWTLNVPTGPNGADNNFWVVNDNEGGVLPPGCGTANNGDFTMHITSVFNPAGGAAYDAGGLCGLLFCPETNMRAESPVINATGQSNLTLAFDFISQGDALIDNASVMYFDGATWNTLNPSIKSTLCPTLQGRWTSFTAALPASANNNPNIRVGVNWTNNDDGAGTDPSVAINNVTVFTSGAPSFSLCQSVDSVTITQPTPLTLALSSTPILCFGDSTACATATPAGSNGNYHYLWSNGDTTATICNLPAGTYVVTVTDSTSGSGPSIVTAYTEDFDGLHGWTLNVPTGPNGADPNFWLIEDNEGGVLPPGCGTANNGDSTLHITSVFNPAGGAAYDAGGLCGLLFCPLTSTRAEGPVFSTVGVTAPTLTFDFISQGDALIDNASVLYHDGTGWQTLNPSIKSPVCPTLQGQWTAFSAALPASCLNNPTVRIGFNWVNNDDGAGTDPSVAINNVLVQGTSLSGGSACTIIDSITITQPTDIVSTIQAYDVSCNAAGDGAVDVDASGGTPGPTGYTYTWNPAAANTDSLSNLSGGTYAVTVTDGNGCTDTLSAFVSEPPAIIPNLSGLNLLCFADTNGCVYVSATGGLGGGFEYQWADSFGVIGTNDTICNLGAGTYWVTITDTTGGGGTQNFTLYQEDFDNPNAGLGWILNVPTGPNGADPNFWLIEDNEGGVLPPGCGVANNGDSTLHITSVFNPAGGAAYDAGGLCGLLFCPLTNSRAEGPVFSTVGFNNATLTFDYISLGDALIDNASVLYHDGTGWQTLNPSIKSPLCPTLQGQWTAFSALLPASCQNNPTVRIGFNWTNNDDGVGSDPSVAINNVLVTASITAPGGPSCSIVDSITLTQPIGVGNTTSSTPAACSTATGTATVNVTGGVGGYTYAWNTVPPQLTATATGLTPGLYIVTFQDANNCTDTAQVTVGNIPGPDVSISSFANVTCFGLSNGQAIASVTGGTAPVSVTWNTVPAQTGLTASNLPAGTYTATASDGFGCQDTAMVTITQPAVLTATATPQNAICNLSNGSVTATGSGGTGPYNFVWSNNQGTPSINGLPAGTYTVTITDANGCQATASAQVLQEGSPTVNLVSTNPTTCFGGANGSATVSASGGVGPYTFTWGTVPTQTGATASALSAGTYTVTVTDANLCTGTLNVTITEPAPLGATTIATDVSCWSAANPNGSVGVLPTGGTPSYTYVWSTAPVQTSQQATGLAPGIYTVTVTDANGCRFIISDTVSLQPSPTVTAGPSVNHCEGSGGAIITAFATGGTPGYYYTWSCNNAQTFCGLDSIHDNDPLANPTQSTWYYIQVTDTNGCTSNIDSLFVNVLPQPIVNTGPDQFICGDSAPCTVLTPNVSNAPGPYTYTWFPAAGLNDSTLANPCARPDTTTIYTLVVAAGNGCVSAYTTIDTLATITIHVNPIPIADAGPDIDLCLGDTTTIQAIGHGAGPAYQYQWSPGHGLSDSTITNPLTSPPATTTYSLVVWSNGCPSYADSVQVRVHTLPTVEAGWDREICYGDSTLLDAQAWGDSTATYTYQWFPGAGLSDSLAEDPNASPGLTTTYHVQAISNHGCRSPLDSATVYLIPTPIADAGPNIFICQGDTATLLGVFSYMTPDSAPPSQIYYSWTPADSLSDSTLIQPLAWPGVSTFYHLSITHRTCTTRDSVLVTVGAPALALPGADTLTICGLDSVQLISIGSIGTNLQWTPPTGLSDPFSPNPMAGPDSSTTYMLSIGQGGCTDTASIHVQVLPTPEAAYINSTPEGCIPHEVNFVDASDGAVNYIWNFGDGSPVHNSPHATHIYDTPGEYSVMLVVQSGGACADTAITTLVVAHDTSSAAFSTDPEFPAELSLPNTSVAFTNLSVNATNHFWEFGDGLSSHDMHPTHIYSEPGSYFATLTVHNIMGCISRITHGPFVVVVPDLFIPNVFSPNGDGINDEFLPEYTGSQPFDLQVFDRWGALLYATKNKMAGWDGNNANGDAVPDGVFYYLVKVGNREFTGNVTLMR